MAKKTTPTTTKAETKETETKVVENETTTKVEKVPETKEIEAKKEVKKITNFESDKRYIIDCPNRANKTVYGTTGVPIVFDDKGKAEVDAVEAKYYSPLEDCTITLKK